MGLDIQTNLFINNEVPDHRHVFIEMESNVTTVYPILVRGDLFDI
jgi:hypothetical protein